MFLATSLCAQSLKSLVIKLDSISTYPPPSIPFQKIKITDDQHPLLVKNWIDSLQKLGYLEGHIVEWTFSDTAHMALVHLGPKYLWSIITIESMTPGVVPESTVRLSGLGKKMDAKECKAWMQKVIRSMDDKGYPFAQAFLDSSILSDGLILSRLHVQTGPQIIIDTIQWDDQILISKNLLRRMIGLQIGMPFNKQIIFAIKKSLSEYPFIESYAEPQIIFFRNKAIVKLFLREKKSSHLDALLGFLPGSGPGEKLKINGNFTGYFLNSFRQGESVSVNFQSLQNNSQSLKLNLNLPYVLNLPFSPFVQFNLYKRDSLFLDVKTEGGAIWKLNSKGRFSFAAGNLKSSLLRPDLKSVQSTHTLPSALDINQTYLVGSLQIKQLNNDRNPSKGYFLKGSINGSTRIVKPNPSILALKDPQDESFSFSTLYQPFSKKGYALDWGIEGSLFLPVGHYSTWYTHIQAHGKNASTTLQSNELYRLGGFSLLRGFDEESILSKQYIVWTNEWRLITGALSYIHLHSDLARVDVFKSDGFKKANYWGLGAGLVFDTSLGLLSIASTAGRIFPEPFNLRALKLHVGYVNYF